MRGLPTAIFIALCGLLAAANGADVIEVYVAVDNEAKEFYKLKGTSPDKIKEDVEFVMLQLNRIYKNIPGLDLEIRTTRVDVLSAKDDFSNSTTGKTNAFKMFDKWEAYLSTKVLPNHKYDVAMLLTGFDLANSRGFNSMTGVARFKRICKENGAALVEFKGLSRSAMTAAHEIGHTLGLNHINTTLCGPAYVMYTNHASKSLNKYLFSDCSIKKLKELVPKIPCLKSTTAPAMSESMKPSAAFLDVDTMCKRATGYKDSTMCRTFQFYNDSAPQGDIVCQRMYCSLAGTTSCLVVSSSDLMVCGSGKRCFQGKCKAAPKDFPVPSTLTDNCLYGDNKVSTRLKNGTLIQQSCSEFLVDKGKMLRCNFSSYTKANCCETCNALRAKHGYCFGEDSSWCKYRTYDELCPRNRYNCCNKCSKIDESPLGK